jgi:transposase
MGFKEGINRAQPTYWALEDLVEAESSARIIDRFVETSDLSALGFTKVKAAKTGRPGYRANELIKLYIYGFENGVRSSRKLERETKRNIEVMWLMQGVTPDHNTISDFRQKNLKAIKNLFKEFVKLCKTWELTGAKVVAQDGSKISASASYKSYVRANTVDERIKRIDERINEYLAKMEQSDIEESGEEQTIAGNKSIKELMALMNQRKKLYTCKEIMSETGEAAMSQTDLDARQMGSRNQGFDIAYNMQTVVDGKAHIILDCDVVNNPTDRGELSPMAAALKEDGYINEETAYVADKGYYSGADLAKMQEMGIKAIVPKQNPPHAKNQPEIFWFTNFTYNSEANTYICPAGYTLYPCKVRNSKSKRRSYNNKAACQQCLHKKTCVGKTKADYRTIKTSEYADICNTANQIYEANKQIYNRRRELVEHPFGTIKRYMNGDHFLLRTLEKVRAE